MDVRRREEESEKSPPHSWRASKFLIFTLLPDFEESFRPGAPFLLIHSTSHESKSKNAKCSIFLCIALVFKLLCNHSLLSHWLHLRTLSSIGRRRILIGTIHKGLTIDWKFKRILSIEFNFSKCDWKWILKNSAVGFKFLLEMWK